MSSAVFYTPRGREVTMTYRPDTSDWNTIWSCLEEDEYELRPLYMNGEALDVGAHIGGATVALLADNPYLRVIAIEALPENVALLRANLASNGLADRATVIHGAAGAGSGTTRIHYGYTGSEHATHHAFIGNLALYQGRGPDHCTTEVEHEHVDVPTVAITALPTVAFAKIDCEGGEWAFLRGCAIPRIHGEAHPTDGHRMADLYDLLPGYDITWATPPAGTDPTMGPLGFEAVLR
jgi:FkbM family methyltransferase